MQKNQPSDNSERVSSHERQLVALQLGEEIFGIDIACIHTVLMPQLITKVPKTPDYIKGVMNLRGQVLPVIDLRVRFGIPAESHPGVRIFIVNVDGLTAGLVVDAVSEVLRLPESDIEPPSALLSSFAVDCIVGIGRVGGKEKDENQRLILLLDLPKILAGSLADTDLTRVAA